MKRGRNFSFTPLSCDLRRGIFMGLCASRKRFPSSSGLAFRLPQYVRVQAVPCSRVPTDCWRTTRTSDPNPERYTRQGAGPAGWCVDPEHPDTCGIFFIRACTARTLNFSRVTHRLSVMHWAVRRGQNCPFTFVFWECSIMLQTYDKARKPVGRICRPRHLDHAKCMTMDLHTRGS